MSAFLWPQWAMAAVLLLDVVSAFRLNGRPRSGTVNGVFAVAVALGLAGITHAGGFWAEWRWPQWTLGTIVVLAVINGTVSNGKPREGSFNGAAILACAAFEALLLYAGGFWG
jgi:hypothetical protein